MMRKLIFLFFLPLLAFAGQIDEHAPDIFTTGEVPQWVKHVDYNLSPSAIQSSQVNTQYLLIDRQHNWENKTTFHRRVIKVLTQAGTQEVAHFKISCNPAFDRVTVHSIRVYRDGVWHDRLSTARHQVLQQEDELNQGVYTGYLTMAYFIDDIRVGDIIEHELSYQTVVLNPISMSFISDFVYLQEDSAIEKIAYRLLAHPSHELQIKPLHTNLSLNERDISSDLREWSIAVSNTQAMPQEHHQPYWLNPLARLQISEAPSWKAIADKMVDVVTLPSTFLSNPHADIQALIQQWKSASKDPHERARLATRFVQNEIRYLSLSSGLASMKPEDPTLTFTRRFGDCKDKTVLLHGLLKLMGISSTPLLVHNESGYRLSEALPSIHCFNHMVLRIELNDGIVFIDPTISLQGGSLQDSFFPSYHYGLLLAQRTSDLIPLPQAQLKSPQQTTISFSLKDPHTVEKRTEMILQGYSADKQRQSLTYKGYDAVSKAYLSYAKSLFEKATTLSPFETSDDPVKNCLKVRESYQIPLILKKGKRSFKIPSELINDYIEDECDLPLDRKTPYRLPFPAWVQEHIHVDHLKPVAAPTSEEFNYDHDSFIFRSSLKRHGTEADFTFEIKLLKDHIAVSEIPSYLEFKSKLDDLLPLKVEFEENETLVK